MLPLARPLKLLLTVTFAVGTILAWLIFAPVQAGGQAAYVIIAGNSMEPVYYRDDLVITQSAEAYQVGDIVAYQDPRIGVVMHRIVRQEGQQFITKGDHNKWFDSYQPLPTEVLGKSWLYIPGAGKVLEQARQPEILSSLTAVLAGFMILTTMMPPAPEGKQGGRRRIAQGLNAIRSLNASQEAVYSVLGVLAFTSLLLGALAFTRPLTQSANDNIVYEHVGKFSYEAPVSFSVYDAGSVKTGDPIFRRLTNTVRVNFEYNLASDKISNLTGTHRLLLELSDSINNWRRIIELQPRTPFSGNAFAIGGAVELDKIQELIKTLNQQTGIQRPYYTLTIIPEVTLQGTINFQIVDDRFTPRLEFRVSDQEMYLPAKAAGDPTDPLRPTQRGVFPQSATQLNSISIFGFGLNVGLARAMASIGLIISVLGIAGFWGVNLLAVKEGEDAAIQIKYDAALVSIENGDPTVGKQIVDVDHFEGLMKLATREGRVVLHRAENGAHEYFVADTNVVYRYRHQAPEVPEQTTEPPKENL